MEVMQEQYKDTKIGRIPKEWEVVRLDEVLDEFQNGYAFSSKGYVKEGIPIVSMAYIGLKGQFSFNYEKANYWSLESKSELSRYLLHKDDLLIAMTDVTPSKNLIGRMVLIDIEDEFLLNQRVGLLKTNDKISKLFLMYIGNSKVWRGYSIGYSTLGVQTNLGTKEIKKGRIPLPPLHEQQKIAEILSTVDEQISTTQAIIDKSKELKKGLMQKLFSEGLGHTEFKDTKIGRIPKCWEVVRLGEYSKLMTGGTPNTKTEEYWDGNIPWMASGDISKKYIEDVEGRITELGLKNSAAKIIPVNSIFIALNGQGKTKGTVAISLKEVTCNQSLAAYILDKESFQPLFVFFYLTTRYWHLRALAGGDDRAGLNLGLLRIVECPLPPFPEQKKIADILSEADAKIEKEEQEKAQLEQLKKGLMQQLLTGQKRVKV